LLLIAEDNQINARLVSLVMERLGFEAHVAENGREVLARLNSGQQYVAILMDMRMPEMDGIEASRRIRLGQAGTIASAIPIYALTANVLKTDREACLEAGMNGYFAKPLQAEEVEAAFREAGIITDE
jgi:CheY-like chemotaxis protein